MSYFSYVEQVSEVIDMKETIAQEIDRRGLEVSRVEHFVFPVGANEVFVIVEYPQDPTGEWGENKFSVREGDPEYEDWANLMETETYYCSA